MNSDTPPIAVPPPARPRKDGLPRAARWGLYAIVGLFALIGLNSLFTGGGSRQGTTQLAAAVAPDTSALVAVQVRGTVAALATTTSAEAQSAAQRRADATVQAFTNNYAPTLVAQQLPTVLARLAPTATPRPAPTAVAAKWVLTYDSAEPSDVRLITLENGTTRVQRATGQFLRLHFRLKSLQNISATVPSGSFLLADDQGRSYASDFEVRQDLPSGASEPFGNASVAPGTTVGLNLSFDVATDATGLVLRMPGANDVAVKR
jgi:hypothetical protein